jgi:putative transposase
MSTLDYKQFSERHRPHIQPPGATFFVTYRLAGSIPKATVREYKAKKDWLENSLRHLRGATNSKDPPELFAALEESERFRRGWFVKFEEILHKAATGPVWMKNSTVADAVGESLREPDGRDYRLDAFSVMSNHVHAVFQPFLSETSLQEGIDDDGRVIFSSDYPGLSRIMHGVKGRSARECNLILSRSGQFWEHESFDHFVRAGKFYKTIKYVLNNPVKAGLVKDWRDWRWNYCRPELSDELQLVDE